MSERITIKDKNNVYDYYPKESDYELACQKLGQLEDIEEELGIDLITLFKVVNADKVFQSEFIGIQEYEVWGMSKKGLLVVPSYCKYGECLETLYFKYYGKTWALTMEELL